MSVVSESSELGCSRFGPLRLFGDEGQAGQTLAKMDSEGRVVLNVGLRTCRGRRIWEEADW